MHLQGIGIDLIGRRRLEKFLENNSRDQCQKLLTNHEACVWQSSEYSTDTFAKFFAAKEAFFKALGGEWLGIEGFSQLEIKLCSEDHFKASDLKERSETKFKGSGIFFNTKDMIGAQIILWDS